VHEDGSWHISPRKRLNGNGGLGLVKQAMENPAHKKFRPLLSAFMDGELGPRERRLVERHLASCKESAQELEALQALSEGIRTAMEEAAEEEDWSTFASEVLAQLPPEKLPFFQRLKIQLVESFTYQRGWVLAGACALLLVCLSTYIWMRPAEPVGYGSPHLSIQTVTAKAGASLKTIITQTESGDAVVWLVEETAPEGEGVSPELLEEGPPLGLEGRQEKGGAL